MAEVLLVEPDERTADSLADTLRSFGHGVLVVETAEEARVLLVSDWTADCVVLELALPDLDGRLLISAIAGRAPVPGILVIAEPGRQTDLVVALKLGADDFLVKPFDVLEFGARLERVIARVRRARTEVPETRIEVGPLVIDRARGRVWLDETPVALSPTEFRVLLVLASRAGEAIVRKDMIQTVWGYDVESAETYAHIVDIHVSRIRRKLSTAGGGLLIEAVRGVGFSLKIDPV